MATFEDFTNWLTYELKLRGWDQAELARRSGVTTAQISRIITGERKTGPEVSRKIARALHLPPEEVFRQAGLLPRQSLQSPGLEELVHLYTEMGEDDRERLLAVARVFRILQDHE